MSTPAQITICGVLGKETIAALVELAMVAGAGLMIQPRALPASADVVDVPVRRLKALPPARRVSSRPAAEEGPLDARVRRALKNGPVTMKDLQAAADLSVYQVRQLVDSGAITATGVTNARRYALPGHSAKEAP